VRLSLRDAERHSTSTWICTAGVECRRWASPRAQARFLAHCLRWLVAACRRSWGRIPLASPERRKGQVHQSATTEFRFGSRLMVARRRRAGTRAL